ncbi:hypothetical protein [Kribbella sp. NPDC049227]|uniref:hypothetical protein n=1 Tax=Kribbella sp. NPDC049227 TaxID=3364113 RepID=UPI003722E1A9
MPLERWEDGQVSGVGWVDEASWKDAGSVLATSVEVPATVRRPADGGDARLDVELHGPNPQERLNAALDELRVLLTQLPDLTAAALRLAPEEWRRRYGEGGPGAADYSGLWLDCVEFHADGQRCLVFDFGDLEQLVLELRPDGSRRVTVEP